MALLGVKRNEVTLETYNNEWEREYEATKKIIFETLGDNVIDVYHVGSTAIKGIVAKPILDVGVFVKRFEDINIKGMQHIGYEYCGEAGVSGRCFFVLRQDGDMSKHHIHCFLDNHSNLLDTIRFRDFLNKHSEYAKQYNDLKIQLYELYPTDRIKYTDGKEAFISKIIELARAERNE